MKLINACHCAKRNCLFLDSKFFSRKFLKLYNSLEDYTYSTDTYSSPYYYKLIFNLGYLYVSEKQTDRVQGVVVFLGGLTK